MTTKINWEDKTSLPRNKKLEIGIALRRSEKDKGDIRINILNRLQLILNGYKLGYGGSHVWISHPNNKRIAIITFN
jgi:hypothetical protein